MIFLKTNHFPKVSQFPQTTKQVQKNLKEEVKDFLETAMKIYSKITKSARKQEKEEQKRLYIKAVGVNRSMIVDNKPTFEE